MADNNYADAQFYIGVMYYHGFGVVQNYQKAIDYFHKAANNGSIDVMMYLGCCYYYGKGVEKNPSLGKEYLSQASKMGNKTAEQILDNIETGELADKSYNAIDKIMNAIPVVNVGWNIGKAVGEGICSFLD